MQHWRCAAWPMTAECWVRHRMSGKNQNTPRKGPNCPILAQIVVLRAAEWPRSRSRRPWPLAVGKGSSVLEHGPCRHPLATLLTAEMALEEEDLPTPVAEGARTSHFSTSIRAG